jgi:hypothetical protein
MLSKYLLPEAFAQSYKKIPRMQVEIQLNKEDLPFQTRKLGHQCREIDLLSLGQHCS